MLGTHMEVYREIKKLGKGAQGSVYQVKNKVDGKDYVLKKIECNDESEASKAFKEAKALQKLQHQYICGYKDFFVKWDKEESAMFVCIVMDYYSMGDLSKVFKQKRTNREYIDETMLKKWFAQMLEALVFVHKKHVIHRDLKPSNIFLTEDLNIVIGDFGVSTIMGDVRTTTRTKVGTMNWMAPEVLERPYDERSDVWGLGCVLLEMATCGFMNVTEISDLLYDIKTKPQSLQQALDGIVKQYTKELCQIIRAMLTVDFEKRPTALELIDLPFVQESLQSIRSPLVVDDQNDKEQAEKNGIVCDVPGNEGVQGVLAFMNKNDRCLSALIKALTSLADFVNKEIFPDDVKFRISEKMRKFIKSEEVQIRACRLLAALATKASDGDVLYSRRIISPVVLAMKTYASSAKLQASAIQLLMALSVHESAAMEIGKLGGVQDILTALRAFPHDVEIATYSCSALWSLAIDEENAKIVTEECALKDICLVMKTHGNEADLMEAACSAIWSLSMEDDNIAMMSDTDAVRLVLHTIKLHKNEAKVVKNACMALATISEADEGSAYEVFRGDGRTPGCTILVDAFEIHKENAEVVENFACCIAELAEYDDLRNEMRSNFVHKLLADVSIKFISNDGTTAQINNALVSLAEDYNGHWNKKEIH